MHDRARECSRDPINRLDLGYYEFAKRVDVFATRLDDHVVGTGDIVGRFDSVDLAYFFCNNGGLADLRLDQDISLDQVEPPRSVRRATLVDQAIG